MNSKFGFMKTEANMHKKIVNKRSKEIYGQWQILWEKLLFGQFLVSSPFPLLAMLKNNE